MEEFAGGIGGGYRGGVRSRGTGGGQHHGIAVAGLPTDICIHPLSNVYMQTRIYICKLPIDSVTECIPIESFVN
jgi:hypothetical protein